MFRGEGYFLYSKGNGKSMKWCKQRADSLGLNFINVREERQPRCGQSGALGTRLPAPHSTDDPECPECPMFPGTRNVERNTHTAPSPTGLPAVPGGNRKQAGK